MMIETVKEHCRHRDCVYRLPLSGAKHETEFCNYICMAGHPRGCPISECTRYRRGKRKVRAIGNGYRKIVGIEFEEDDQ